MDEHLNAFIGGLDPRPAPFPTLTVQQLAELPEPTWTIEGVVPEGSSVIYGRSSSFKSFVALDMALCVAAGLPWHGHDVQTGAVLYVAGEGGGGLAQRIAAWQAAHEHEHPDLSAIRFLTRSIDVLDARATEQLARTVEELPEPPVLVVVDTLARSMIGDENSTRDMGTFVAALDRLPVASRVVVHHTGANGERERGAVALRCAVETMIRVEREGNAPTVQLVCDKAPRDGEPWSPLDFAVERVADSLALHRLPMLEAAVQREDDRREKVLAFITEHGPSSQTRIEKGIGGKVTLIRSTLDQLATGGLLAVTTGERNARIYSIPSTPSPDKGRGGDGVGSRGAEAPRQHPVPDPPHTPFRGWGSRDGVPEPGTASPSLLAGTDSTEPTCPTCGGQLVKVATQHVCFACKTDQEAVA
jgi:AAA domain